MLVLDRSAPAADAREPAPRRAATGTVPVRARRGESDSPVARWWVPVLTGELRAPHPRVAQLQPEAVRRHRTDDDSADPLIIPSEWGVF
jgi:hypothetical protein